MTLEVCLYFSGVFMQLRSLLDNIIVLCITVTAVSTVILDLMFHANEFDDRPHVKTTRITLVVLLVIAVVIRVFVPSQLVMNRIIGVQMAKHDRIIKVSNKVLSIFEESAEKAIDKTSGN